MGMDKAEKAKIGKPARQAEGQEESKEEVMALGGNIELSGFSKLDRGELIVLKKIVGSYARKFQDSGSGFEKLGLRMKVVHKKEKSEKFELNGFLEVGGKRHSAELTERNLFFALDKILKKLEKMIE
ncbi:hypothetical protein KY320_00695 [Candidatus Woesearchaeota archaeon]|nr:hypothetical protein [Candidatus Woesearchaeota archaeon]